MSLDIEVGELAEHMGYDEDYVVNVLKRVHRARPGFRRAFGETIGAWTATRRARGLSAAGAAPTIQLHG